MPVIRDIGSYIGVPVKLSDGRVHGSLCWASKGPRPDLGEPELRFMEVLAGIVLQAYLRDSPELAQTILDWAASSQRTPLTVRLVKGAYWDHELVQARQHGWSVPVFEVKADCDRNFEELTGTLLRARPNIRVAVASHNLRSVSHAIAYNRLLGGDDSDL